MSRLAFLAWRSGRSAAWQALGVLLAWLYVVILHLDNDGLWYQGDAPRHAANGLFWWDLLTNLPLDPMGFALGYYARYPVINPIVYPPAFYLAEGAAFSLLGPSPLVAKGLVAVLALGASLYAAAWMRRWIAQEAGWGGALLILQPGMILWATAVMLNVPSMAVGLAALYHARRWLDAPDSRHIYPAVGVAVLAILTYYPGGIVVPIIAAWILAERRWQALGTRRALLLAGLSVVALLPSTLVVLWYDPVHLAVVSQAHRRPMWTLSKWTWYLMQAPQFFGTWLLLLAGLGIVLGIGNRHWRRETKLILIWVTVCYLGFSFILVREERFVLLLGPPIIFLCAMGLLDLCRRCAGSLGMDPTRTYLVVMSALIVFHAARAPFVDVPRIQGFKEVAAFFEQVAPGERVFYDGFHNGVFSFYRLANDRHFAGGVALGSKLLYVKEFRQYKDLVGSPPEAIETLRRQCGCEWLAIERGEMGSELAAAGYLREAVTGSEVAYVRSFPIVGAAATQVDVYRFRIPVEKPPEVRFRLPNLRGGAEYRLRPLNLRRGQPRRDSPAGSVPKGVLRSELELMFTDASDRTGDGAAGCSIARLIRYPLSLEEADYGQPRLRLLMDPAVGPRDPHAVGKTFLRRAPLVTATGKILHLRATRRFPAPPYEIRR